MLRKISFTIALVSFVAVAAAAVLIGGVTTPWDSNSAEARTAVLSGGVFEPIGDGTQPASHAPATVPGLISFQGRLTNPATGNAINNGSYSITFSVYDAAAGGAQVWTETQTVAVTGGLFDVQLGSVTPFQAGAFDGSTRYLEVQVAADPAMTPRLPFTSVAYAFHSLTADSANSADVSSDVNCTDCVDAGEAQFNYAASATEGGPANGLTCTDCVSTSDIADGGVTNSDVADGALSGNDIQDGSITTFDLQDDGVLGTDIGNQAIQSSDIGNGQVGSAQLTDNGVAAVDVAFNYAGSTTEGGPASDIACVDCVSAGEAQFNYAGSPTEGGPASDVVCVPVGGCISGSEIVDGQVGTADITDNSIGAADVQFNYAGSTAEGGDANNAQMLDNTDSASFLRSDTGDAFTSGTLTLNSGTALDLRNAGGIDGIRLSANGGTGTLKLCFFSVSNCGESFAWTNAAGTFDLSDDLNIAGNLNATGNLHFGNNKSWVDGGLLTISSNGNYLRVEDAGICVDDGVDGAANDECDEFGGLFPGSIHADQSITANAFDVAERFTANTEGLDPGELVALDGGTGVRLAGGTPYDPHLLGVVSGDPGVILGWETGGDVPVALSGRVPVKVTLENGPIAVGDYLTSSSMPGLAMKATEPGSTVGIALEAFDGAGGSQGEVLTFVSLSDRNSAGVIQQLQSDLDDLSTRVAELEGGMPGEGASASADASPTSSDSSLLVIVGGLGALITLLAVIVAVPLATRLRAKRAVA